MIKIAFRVDGSTNIGMGHIMRCLSLAKGFQEQDSEIHFISKFKNGIEKIQQEGFKVLRIKTRRDNLINIDSHKDNNLELNEIIEYIREYDIQILFIDSYYVTEEYFLKLKPFVKKIAYIDDINKFTYPVDILINGNITAEYMNYKRYTNEEIMLLGTKYNLIRDEFKNLPTKAINNEVKEIMITTGGSDPYNMSCKILDILLKDDELSSLIINVIIGSGFVNKQQLYHIYGKHKNVVLYENVKYMSKIMSKSDVVISSGGSTLYELCACGTPTISFIMADNQEELVIKMEQMRYVKSLGWYYEVTEERITNTLKYLIEAYDERVSMSNKGQRLIDARGVNRIVKEIMSRVI